MIREFGYEYDASLQKNLWNTTEGQFTDEKLLGAYCLRSGRDALKAIARETTPCAVYLPALSCDSMFQPFEQYGHQVCFYELNEDYSVQLDHLRPKEQRAFFLYLDYFGQPAINDTALKALRTEHPNLIFIEDRTHNLFWERKSDFQPDYTVASLRKWLAVPDGGLLWGRIQKPLNEDASFYTTRLKAQCMRHEFQQNGDESIKTEYRKIFSTVSDLMDHDEPCKMSAYSYNLASNADLSAIKATRKKNAETLSSILSSCGHIKLIENAGGLYVPFFIQNRDEIQRRLSAMGIFNTIIWPLTEKQKEACSVARRTVDHMLAAPCDQRYTEEDMAYIGKEIIRVVCEVNG